MPDEPHGPSPVFRKLLDQPEAEEAGYRRGFIQGIQFARNSLRDGYSEEDINNAQAWLHIHWRCRTPLSNRTLAPMSALEIQPFSAALRRMGEETPDGW